MISSVGLILVLVMLQNLVLLGMSRVRSLIRLAAAQGVIVSLLPIVVASGDLSARELMLAITSCTLKGIAFPWLLYRALRGTGIRREGRPIVGYSASIALGIGAIVLALVISSRAQIAAGTIAALALPAALATMFTGLMLIMIRRKALLQLLGYLVLENGIFAFGFALQIQAGWLVELGVLIDALMAVLVMGVAIYHMHRTYETIDVTQLSSLTDWHS